MPKLTLQIKYALSFSMIFLIVLFYIVTTQFESEKKDLTTLSKQNFAMIFQTINSTGIEALSTGDKPTLRLIVKDLFDAKIEGLETVFFVSAKTKSYFDYRDESNHNFTDQIISDSVFSQLDSMVDKELEVENKVYLTKKLIYEIAGGKVFLGYSQLVFSLEHINARIAEKKQSTFLTGLLGFVIALVIIAVVTSLLIKRIKILNRAAGEVAEGVFNPIEVLGHDELSELSVSFNNMIVAVKERLMMAKYVSGSTIDMIRDSHPDEQLLGGQKEELCVWFSDIRGFTAFSEGHTPQEVVHYLNQLLDEQVKILKNYHGDIDKFVGDEIMAVFRGEEKEIRSIQASIDIQNKMRDLTKIDKKFTSLKIGIGINVGEVVSGNIGSHDRMDYTAIGDTVNTAARLCSNAKADEIILSEYILEKIPNHSFKLSESFQLELKNKKKALNLYRVIYE